jgi:hypothetical protein
MLAMTFVFVIWISRHPHPMEWEPYSVSEIHRLNANGIGVALLVEGDWTLTSLGQHRAKSIGVDRIIANQGMVPMLLRLSDDEPIAQKEFFSQMKSLGVKTVPLIAIYPAAGGNPVAVPLHTLTSASFKSLCEQAQGSSVKQ